MTTPKTNPKRWYWVMIMCMLVSFVSFIVGPRIGYEPGTIRDVGLLIGLWAPIMGILGVRAETLQRKQN